MDRIRSKFPKPGVYSVAGSNNCIHCSPSLFLMYPNSTTKNLHPEINTRIRIRTQYLGLYALYWMAATSMVPFSYTIVPLKNICTFNRGTLCPNNHCLSWTDSSSLIYQRRAQDKVEEPPPLISYFFTLADWNKSNICI